MRRFARGWWGSSTGLSPHVSPRNGMTEQVVKDEDCQKRAWKSDELIVLGVWESHIQGEGARKEEPDWVLTY